VSKKLKNKEFHLSIGVLIRWAIFGLIIYFSINYLSGTKSNLNTNINPKILGVNTEPAITKVTQVYETYKSQVIKFANDQIIDIKKQVVTKVYDEIIKNIDSSKK
jgi:hypothetical protein